MRTIHSSKFLGLVAARARSSAASIMPSMHLTCSSTGSIVMLFCGAARAGVRGGSLREGWRRARTDLVRVGDPGALGADVRDALVLVPVVGLGERLVDAVVEVAASARGRKVSSHVAVGETTRSATHR